MTWNSGAQYDTYVPEVLDVLNGIRAARRAKTEYEEGTNMLRKYEIIERKFKNKDQDDEGEVDL